MKLCVDDLVVFQGEKTSKGTNDYLDVVISTKEVGFDTVRYDCRTFSVIGDVGYVNGIPFKIKEVFRYNKKNECFEKVKEDA